MIQTSDTYQEYLERRLRPLWVIVTHENLLDCIEPAAFVEGRIGDIGGHQPRATAQSVCLFDHGVSTRALE